MLEPDSFFRKTPYILDDSQKRFTSALRYAYEIAELQYRRLLEGLTLVSEARKDISPDHRIGIFADVWGVIDNLNRARQLLASFPDVKDSPKVQEFVKAADDIRLLRNRLQHMDQDFLSGKNLTQGYPVYGNITWFQHPDEQAVIVGCMIAGPSSQRDGGTVSSTQIPGEWERPIGNVCLAAFDRYLRVSRAVKLLSTVMETLDRTFSIEIREFAEKIAVERQLTVERVMRPAAGDFTLVLVGEMNEDGKSFTLKSQSNEAAATATG